MGMLEAHDVSIRYMIGDFKEIGLKEYVMRKLTGHYEVREFWADRNVSFVLEKGDMLGIIGSNGAGKSTLLKTISGIMEPTVGSIHREGSIAALLELGSGFDGDLTVRENTYLRGAMMGYTRKFMDDTYEQIIEFAELKDFQDRPFKQLSTGMKSRLAFSIASLVQPDILILDEVLSVGDGAFRKKSEAKMREIIQGGATTILVSHSLGQVREMCNKVLWLHRGEQIVFGDDVQGICDQYQAFLDGGQNVADLPKSDTENFHAMQTKETNLNEPKRFNKALKRGTFPWKKLCQLSLLGFLILYLVIAMASPPTAQGECSSFELSLISLYRRMSFQITETDYQLACELFPEHASILRAQFAALPKNENGAVFPWYFGVYAPLCLPTLCLLLLLQLNPIYTLPITNALFLTLSLWTVYKILKQQEKIKLLVLLFLGFSPIIRYIVWESYEVLTFSFVVIATTFWLNRNRKLSALFLSLAGTMNATVTAFGIFMIFDFFWDIFLACDKKFKIFLSSCQKQWKYILLYAICFTPCLITMAFSCISLGNIAPILSSSAHISGISSQIAGIFGRYLSYLFDLNFGLLLYIPVIILLFVTCCLKGIVTKQYYLFFTLLGVLATILAYSITYHINCGMAGIARYNSWILPVLILTVVLSVDKIFVSKKSRAYVWKLTVLSLIWCVFIVGVTKFSEYGGNYRYWTPTAEIVLDSMPQLYNPLPSTFNSRTTHIDGGYNVTEPIVYSNKEGYVRKVLVPPGMLEESINLLWIPSEDREFAEKQCTKVTSSSQYYYLDFPPGTSVKRCEEYALGETIPFEETEKNAHLYFIDGFSRTETDFAWTDGTEGTLRLLLTEEVSDNLVLQINLKRIYNAPQRMVITSGETALFDEVLESASEPITVSIPADCVRERLLEINFRFPGAVSPKSLGVGTDIRRLAFGISSFTLESAKDYAARMRYKLGHTVSFDGTERDAHLYFVQGMSKTETDFAWTDGTKGVLRLLLDEEINHDLILQLNLKRIYNAPQRIMITCGDTLLFDEIIETAQTVRVPVPAECVQEHILELSLQFPGAVSPKSIGAGEDTRSLAFGIYSFSVDLQKEVQ